MPPAQKEREGEENPLDLFFTVSGVKKKERGKQVFRLFFRTPCSAKRHWPLRRQSQPKISFDKEHTKFTHENLFFSFKCLHLNVSYAVSVFLDNKKNYEVCRCGESLFSKIVGGGGRG